MGSITKNTDTNWLASYALEVAAETSRIVKFKLGSYSIGSDGEAVGVDDEFAVLVESLTREWVRWEDGLPADKRTAVPSEGERLPKRDDYASIGT